MAKRNKILGWRFAVSKEQDHWVVSDTEYTMEHTGKHRVAALCFSPEEASAVASLMNKDGESARRTMAGFLDKWSASWGLVHLYVGSRPYGIFSRFGCFGRPA